MAKFMLVLFDNPSDYASMTPQQMQELIKDYGRWADQMGKEGKLLGGEKLTEEGGKILTGKGPKAVLTDGPYAETKEVLSGYFTIKADSYDEAVAIARTCPHIVYGCSTHIRRIDEMP